MSKHRNHREPGEFGDGVTVIISDDKSVVTGVSDERLELIARGIAVRLDAGASGAPDLDRDIMRACTELLSLRSSVTTASQGVGVKDAIRLIEKRIETIVNENGDYEPDTNYTNLPEWAETVIEELEDLIKVIGAVSSLTHPVPTLAGVQTACETCGGSGQIDQFAGGGWPGQAMQHVGCPDCTPSPAGETERGEAVPVDEDDWSFQRRVGGWMGGCPRHPFRSHEGGRGIAMANRVVFLAAVPKFQQGDRVRKTKGSSWQGPIVGFYSSSLTDVGYAVESENEPGSVQIYPESALELVTSSLKKGE